MTAMDFVAEVHDTHHPVGTALYYEDQKVEAARNARSFVTHRVPKFYGYFERILAKNGSGFAVGRRLTYVDLTLFQIVEGLRYAFPKASAAIEARAKKLVALHDRVAARPRVRAYLASPRRIAFNEDGIFRHYRELDLRPGKR
jgi:glutathione S-transferase